MKGIKYLVDDEGKKTHAVLELDVWQEALEKLLSDAPSALQERQPGFLNELLLNAGYTSEQLEAMNEASTEEALKPLSVRELGLTDSL